METVKVTHISTKYKGIPLCVPWWVVFFGIARDGVLKGFSDYPVYDSNIKDLTGNKEKVIINKLPFTSGTAKFMEASIEHAKPETVSFFFKDKFFENVKFDYKFIMYDQTGKIQLAEKLPEITDNGWKDETLITIDKVKLDNTEDWDNSIFRIQIPSVSIFYEGENNDEECGCNH